VGARDPAARPSCDLLSPIFDSDTSLPPASSASSSTSPRPTYHLLAAPVCLLTSPPPPLLRPVRRRRPTASSRHTHTTLDLFLPPPLTTIAELAHSWGRPGRRTDAGHGREFPNAKLCFPFAGPPATAMLGLRRSGLSRKKLLQRDYSGPPKAQSDSGGRPSAAAAQPPRLRLGRRRPGCFSKKVPGLGGRSSATRSAAPPAVPQPPRRSCPSTDPYPA
jgi:hypothetical protein